MITVPNNLIRRCLDNDRKAQKELYELTLPYLRATVQRQLYDRTEWMDVLQEVYLRIFRSLSSFNSEKGTFLNWSSRIAVNTAISFGVRSAAKQTTTLDFKEHDSAVESFAIESLTAEQLLAEISKMPEDFYRIFMLVSIEGFTHQESAKLLTITADLSRQRLSRAKAWIRKHVLVMELEEHNVRQKLNA